MRTFDRLAFAYLCGITAFSCVQNAHAEEQTTPSSTDTAPTTSSPIPPSTTSSASPPPPSPAPSQSTSASASSSDALDARDDRVRTLRRRAEEINAEAELEHAKSRLENARRAEQTHDAESQPALFRAGRVLFSNLAGISVFGAAAGPSAVLYGIGPVSFSHSVSDTHAISSVSFSPSLDVVVGEHLTLGGSISVDHFRSRTTNDFGDTKLTFTNDITSATVAPRIGIVQRLGSDVWVWPRLAAYVGESWGNRTNSPEIKATSIGMQLDVPFVFPLSRWVFLQVAPIASYTHTSSTEDSSGFSFGSYARLGLAL